MPKWVYERHLRQTLAAVFMTAAEYCDSDRYFGNRAEYGAVHDSEQWKVACEKQEQENRPR